MDTRETHLSIDEREVKKDDGSDARSDRMRMTGKRVGGCMCFRLILASALVALALGEDLRSGRIPNRLLLTGGFLGLVSYGWQSVDLGPASRGYSDWMGIDLSDPVWLGMAGDWFLTVLGNMLFPMLAAFLFLALFFLFGALGAGDVKLLALLAGLLPADFYRFMLGIALGQGALLGLWSFLKKVRMEDVGRKGMQKRIHFTICISSGFLACLAGRLTADFVHLLKG